MKLKHWLETLTRGVSKRVKNAAPSPQRRQPQSSAARKTPSRSEAEAKPPTPPPRRHTAAAAAPVMPTCCCRLPVATQSCANQCSIHAPPPPPRPLNECIAPPPPSSSRTKYGKRLIHLASVKENRYALSAGEGTHDTPIIASAHPPAVAASQRRSSVSRYCCPMSAALAAPAYCGAAAGEMSTSTSIASSIDSSSNNRNRIRTNPWLTSNGLAMDTPDLERRLNAASSSSAAAETLSNATLKLDESDDNHTTIGGGGGETSRHQLQDGDCCSLSSSCSSSCSSFASWTYSSAKSCRRGAATAAAAKSHAYAEPIATRSTRPPPTTGAAYHYAVTQCTAPPPFYNNGDVMAAAALPPKAASSSRSSSSKRRCVSDASERYSETDSGRGKTLSSLESPSGSVESSARTFSSHSGHSSGLGHHRDVELVAAAAAAAPSQSSTMEELTVECDDRAFDRAAWLPESDYYDSVGGGGVDENAMATRRADLFLAVQQLKRQVALQSCRIQDSYARLQELQQQQVVDPYYPYHEQNNLDDISPRRRHHSILSHQQRIVQHRQPAAMENGAPPHMYHERLDQLELAALKVARQCDDDWLELQHEKFLAEKRQAEMLLRQAELAQANAMAKPPPPPQRGHHSRLSIAASKRQRRREPISYEQVAASTKESLC